MPGSSATSYLYPLFDGVLLIDKPSGPTSADIVSAVKKHLRQKKVGHAGTLDPLATGLLVILLGNATRLQFLFMESFKVYEGDIRLGIATDTDDITGKVIASVPNVSQAIVQDFSSPEVQNRLIEILQKAFLGEQLQQPPNYSARKINGERSYAVARSGREVKVEPKLIRVEELQLRFTSENRLWYRVRCSKGTYVRALARDMGKHLGIPACLESIRRVASEPFSVEEALLYEGLEVMAEEIGKRILSMEFVLASLPRITLNRGECEKLRRGDQRFLRDLKVSRQDKTQEKYENMAAVFDMSGKLVGVVEKDPARQGSLGNEENGWRVRFLVS